jgi:hypothetical protein
MIVVVLLALSTTLLIWFVEKIRHHFCPCPMPGPRFVWDRCCDPCPWCDHVDAWESEGYRAPELGPYRSRID